MELCAGAALTGLGYLLNKQRDSLNKSVPPDARDKPSMNNVYASDYWSAVKKDELRRGNEMATNAKAPFVTGVVPRPAYASMFAGEEYLKTYAKQQSSVPSLTGDQVPVEHFTHNNMQPFISTKGITQNVDPDAHNALLERFTGHGSDVRKPKQETKCFFEPAAHMTNICGMPNNSEYYMERLVKPVVRNNDFPIEQIRVAPGLNKGYTAEGSGGFQQSDTLEYARGKTIDELRPLSRPKVTLESRPQGAPGSQIQARGMIGEVAKNRPDTSFEQTPEQWIRTTGANLKETVRPIVNLKPTARVEGHTEYQGAATMNASQPGRGADYDHGKAGIMVYDTERQTTETRTVVTNVTSMVKAIVAPLLDIFRHTPKEYTLDAPRMYGNMSAQIPEKPTLYDPVNHMMRTTIKETLIHDAQVGNLKGPESGTVHAEDEARTTIRETLPVEDTTRNMSGRTYRVVMYSPDAVAKKTMKETTEEAHNKNGYVTPFNAEGAYNYIKVKMPHTQKEFIADYEYYGTSQSKTDFRPTSREAEKNAEIDGTREMMNIAAGHTPCAGGLFTNLDPEKHHQDTRKALVDSIAPRSTGNISRVYQESVMPMAACAQTRGAEFLNANEERLDPVLLNSLKSNPYNLSINPLAAD